MGKKNKKRKYKYAVKRPSISKKDIGKGLKAYAKGGVKGRDIVRAGRKLKKKYGVFPRLPGIMRGRNRPGERGGSMYDAALYRKVDGGTADTAYVKGPAPGGGRSESSRKSKKRDDRSRSSSGSSGGGSMRSSVGEYRPFDFSQMTAAYDKQIQDLNNQIAGMTANFQNQATQMQQQMAAERAEAAQRLQEQQNMFGQQMAAAQPRDRIQGIRFADYGTGGATRQQLARQGTSGTFGRTGDRLMKISSLNV